jgi:hypothetical protein
MKPIQKREINYVKSVKGFVSMERRINGVLAAARTIGDFELGEAISHEPDLFEYGLRRWGGLRAGDDDGHSLLFVPPKAAPVCSDTPLSYLPSHFLPPVPFADAFPSGSVPPPGASLPALPRVVLPSVIQPLPCIPPSLRDHLNHWLETPIPFRSLHAPPPLRIPHNTLLPPEYACIAPPPAPSPCVQEWDREDVALVLACDGLFDVADDQLIADVACPWMHPESFDLLAEPTFSANTDRDGAGSGTQRPGLIPKGKLAELAALRLRSCASAMGSADNISVIVVFL